MTSVRARANQKLYHAKILINYWRVARAEEQIAATVLAQAFGSAVCEHLAGAYGWFLLEIAQPAEMPAVPPRCCGDLPPIPEGKETPPEILEFKQLESEPWLAHILNSQAGQPDDSQRAAAMENLALANDHVFDPDQATQWADRLGDLFDRMTDSLDEY